MHFGFGVAGGSEDGLVRLSAAFEYHSGAIGSIGLLILLWFESWFLLIHRLFHFHSRATSLAPVP